MRYLVVTPNHPPFLTNYFQVENHFVQGMHVYDLELNKHTFDGVNWYNIEIDHL